MTTMTVYAASVNSAHKRAPLQALHETARANGVQSRITRGPAVIPADIAVLWGAPKPDGAEARREFMVRNAVFRAHAAGTIVVLETPLLGRRVGPKLKRSRLMKTLFPASWPHTRLLLPPHRYLDQVHTHYRVGIGGAFPDDGGFRLAAVRRDRWPILKADLGLDDPRPWRSDGEHVIVIGQVPGDASLRGADITQWLLDTCRAIAAVTERPVIARPHPLMHEHDLARLQEALRRLPTVRIDDGRESLAALLARAWATVTYSSGAGIESLFAGVPVIAMNQASPVYHVADHTIADVVDPGLRDRSAWLSTIAACQWSAEEFRDGSVWAAIADLLALEQREIRAVPAQ
jgi:hypothetical protein